jgi:hypothetical protein
MIIWGGANSSGVMRSGGRYDPNTDAWTATSITHAPTGRASHTAVWTGSEMIVWGGNGGPLGLLNTGGQYNPGTDAWSSTSTTDAPIARDSHTGVWTGTEMIVWGGGGYLNSGGRYNPNADSWTATSISNAPSGRVYHTAIWAGSEMVVWGGNTAIDVSNTGGRYCAQSNAPTPTPTPGPILLRGQGKKVGGINTSRLKWRGASSSNVDVYRDGTVIATTANDGLYDDSTGSTGQASFMYKVCEAATLTCSNPVTVNFPP